MMTETIVSVKVEPLDNEVINFEQEIDPTSLQFPIGNAECEEADELDGTDPKIILVKQEAVYIKEESTLLVEHSSLESTPERDHRLLKNSTSTNQNSGEIETAEEICVEDESEDTHQYEYRTATEESTSFVTCMCRRGYSTTCDSNKCMCMHLRGVLDPCKDLTRQVAVINQNPTNTDNNKTQFPCDELFNQSEELDSHMNSDTKKKGFSCTHCSKSFSRNSVLNRHMYLHVKKPFVCTQCSKSFNRKSVLNRHMHLHSGNKAFSCSKCAKPFSRKNALTRHMYVHVENKPFSCGQCNLSFAEKSVLRRHMNIHTGNKLFSCHECGKSFVQKVGLERHRFVHTGNKPFSCSECGHSFAEKCALVRHMYIHSGNKPFSCSVCDKSFSLKSSLLRHINVHTGEKNYSCPECEKSFTLKSSLVRHMNRHTKVEVFS